MNRNGELKIALLVSAVLALMIPSIADAASYPGDATSGGTDVFSCTITDLSTLPAGTYTESSPGVVGAWASDYPPLGGQVASSFVITVAPDKTLVGTAVYPFSGVNATTLISNPYTASYFSGVGGQWDCSGTHLYGVSATTQPTVPQAPGRYLVYSPSKGCLNVLDSQVAATLNEHGTHMAAFIDGYRLDATGGKQYIGLSCDNPSKYGATTGQNRKVGPNGLTPGSETGPSNPNTGLGTDQVYELYKLTSPPIDPYSSTTNG